MADEYCEKWTQKLRARLGDAVYADGETSLAQATLDVLLKKRRLLVAADEVTGRLIGAQLQPWNTARLLMTSVPRPGPTGIPCASWSLPLRCWKNSPAT